MKCPETNKKKITPVCEAMCKHTTISRAEVSKFESALGKFQCQNLKKLCKIFTWGKHRTAAASPRSCFLQLQALFSYERCSCSCPPTTLSCQPYWAGGISGPQVPQNDGVGRSCFALSSCSSSGLYIFMGDMLYTDKGYFAL